MITPFPITFWTDKPIDGRTGTSWFFMCSAVRGHRYAAAIMAQEIYETRYKTVRALGITAVLLAIVAGVTLGRTPTSFDIAAVVVFALAASMLFAGLYPPWQRELELRGQAIECEVRVEFYGSSFMDAVDEAATQLTRYDQFKGWGSSRIDAALIKRAPFAHKWTAANRATIQRAYDQAS